MATAICSNRESVVSQLHCAIRGKSYVSVHNLILEDFEYDNAISPKHVFLLWQRNGIGWNALHCCASHGTPNLGWWRWIVARALCELGYFFDDDELSRFMRQDSSPYSGRKLPEKIGFLSTRTDLGYSCVDLFFLRYLYPLPWQHIGVHQNAALLKDSIRRVLNGGEASKNILEAIRRGIASYQREEQRRQERCTREHNRYSWDSTKIHTINKWDEGVWPRPHSLPDSTSYEHNPEFVDDIRNIVNFWHYMEVLLMAAHLGTLDFSQVQFPSVNLQPQQYHITVKEMRIPCAGKCGSKRHWRVVHALARTSCPIEVARLAVALYPTQPMERDENKSLPLHIAAASPVYASIPPPLLSERGHSTDKRIQAVDAAVSPMIQVLLECHPSATQHTDRQGRLPLNIALACGKTWDTGCQSLWQACPDVLLFGARDVPTRLFPFLLAAVHPCCRGELTVRAKLLASRSIGTAMWRYLSPTAHEDVLTTVQAQVDVFQVNTIFEVLRAAPCAICWGIPS